MSRLEVPVQELLSTVEEINTGAVATWRHAGVADLHIATATTRADWTYEPEPGINIAFHEIHAGYRSWDEPFIPCLETELFSSVSISMTLPDRRETMFGVRTHPRAASDITRSLHARPSDPSAEDLLESMKVGSSIEMLAALKEASETGAAKKVSGSRGITLRESLPNSRPHVGSLEVIEDGKVVKRDVSVDQKAQKDRDYRLFFRAAVQLAGSTVLLDELVYTNTELEGKFPPVTTEALAIIGKHALGAFEAIQHIADAASRNNRQVQNRRGNGPKPGKRNWAKR